MLRPCYLLRKARDDVEKYSDARGALKQAMCTMSVARDQVRVFFFIVYILILRGGERGEGIQDFCCVSVYVAGRDFFFHLFSFFFCLAVQNEEMITARNEVLPR